MKCVLCNENITNRQKHYKWAKKRAHVNCPKDRARSAKGSGKVLFGYRGRVH